MWDSLQKEGNMNQIRRLVSWVGHFCSNQCEIWINISPSDFFRRCLSKWHSLILKQLPDLREGTTASLQVFVPENVDLLLLTWTLHHFKSQLGDKTLYSMCI